MTWIYPIDFLSSNPTFSSPFIVNHFVFAALVTSGFICDFFGVLTNSFVSREHFASKEFHGDCLIFSYLYPLSSHFYRLPSFIEINIADILLENEFMDMT